MPYFNNFLSIWRLLKKSVIYHLKNPFRKCRRTSRLAIYNALQLQRVGKKLPQNTYFFIEARKTLEGSKVLVHINKKGGLFLKTE